jgi:hypothetical protein
MSWRYHQAFIQEKDDEALSIFLDFLEKYGNLICQYPLPQPLRSQYVELVRANPVPGVNPDDDPLGMEQLPPYMKKIS